VPPVQMKPHSTVQVAEHPSPATEAPSSHPSGPAFWPSPQTVLHVDRSQAGVVHTYPGFHRAVGAAPITINAVAVVAGFIRRLAFRHRKTMWHESGVVGVPPVQLKPHSTVQVAEHPSPDSESPSSHPSGPAFWPSPQTVLHVD
jgi:hypothetical protein